MVPYPHLLAALLWAGGALAAGAAERSAAPRLCPEDAPAGVRLPPRPGCTGSAQRAGPKESAGFRDVGGVKLRIGGQVGAEYGVAR